MTTKILTLFLSLLTNLLCLAQGGIDAIKGQDYMKYAAKVDCSNSDGDNLSERICANLAYQKSDSLLADIYTKLLDDFKHAGNDSAKLKIVALQTAWRSLRDKHCSIVYDSFENCGGCHERSIAYLTCLKELTENRAKEMITLRHQLFATD